MRILSLLRRPRSRLVTTWEELDSLQPDWDRLWQQGASRGTCYSYRWVREVLRRAERNGDPVAPWCVVLRDRAGRVNGIAPLARESGRRVRSLPDLVEWNHCFLHEGPVEPLARAVARRLDRGLMDGLRLSGILRAQALELVRAWGASWRCSLQRMSQVQGPGPAGTTYWDRRAIPIAGTWEEFLRGRGGNYRSSLKRSMKRLEKAGKVRFWRHSAGRQVCGEPLADEAILAALRPIEERAWQGERHFAADGDGALKLDVLRSQGQLELSILFLDERAISYIFGSACGRVATLKYLGFEPEHTELSPGVITLAEMIRTSHEQPWLEEINLCGSQHRYKTQVSSVIESAFVVELAGRTPRGLASALARQARPGQRVSGRAALELLLAPEPVGEQGEGIEERVRQQGA